MKRIKYLLMLMVGVLVGTIVLSNAFAIYTVTPTFPGTSIPQWNGGIYQFDFTFVTATDTAYCPMVIPRPKSGTDTTWYCLNLGVAPGVSYGTADSSNVYFGFQTSADNSNWNSLTQIRVDSAATGTAGTYVFHTYNLGVYETSGLFPYVRVVVIGKTPSGGKANEVGNQVKIFGVRQYNY
jgi:hypothetical protein